MPAFLVSLILLFCVSSAQAAPVPDPQGEWARLTREAAAMGLSSRFLRLLPLEFVKLEFADLKNVAAEYHPESHRMVFHALPVRGQSGEDRDRFIFARLTKSDVPAVKNKSAPIFRIFRS